MATLTPVEQRLADSNLRLQDEIRRRRVLERQVLSVAEGEQRRISLDLHDGLGQHLTGLAFLARALADGLATERHRLAADADWIVHLLNESISQTRALARGLWPVNLEHESVLASIRRLAEDLESIYGVSCAVQAIDAPQIASQVAANHVYRIVQEAANNAIKHGRARRLTFRLEAVGEAFTVAVLNDGVAIEAKQLAGGRGLGVIGMRLRAEALGGTLCIEPLPAGGTEVTLSLPGIGSDAREET
jgi:signal transduction histidine kinase